MRNLRLCIIVMAALALAAPAPRRAAAQQQDKPEGDLFYIAQVHYGGGGDWYEDRTSMVRLQARLEDEFGVKPGGERKIVKIMDEDLFSYPMLFMAGHGNVVFSPEEVNRLRTYFQRGGFLWASDDYGMSDAFMREMGKVFPGAEFIEIPFGHQIYNEPYKFPDGLPKIHEHAGGAPKGLGLFVDGRMMVFFDVNTDIGDGLEAPTIHNDPAEVRENAARMAVNIAFFAITQ